MILAAVVAAVAVRAEIVSGTPQTARAYVVNSEARYGAEFEPIVVRLTGGKRVSKRRMRFVCIGDGCAFYTDSPQHGDRHGPGDYEVDVDEHGQAELRVTMLGRTPAGTYRVYAEPVPAKGERPVRSAPFVLTSR